MNDALSCAKWDSVLMCHESQVINFKVQVCAGNIKGIIFFLHQCWILSVSMCVG